MDSKTAHRVAALLASPAFWLRGKLTVRGPERKHPLRVGNHSTQKPPKHRLPSKVSLHKPAHQRGSHDQQPRLRTRLAGEGIDSRLFEPAVDDGFLESPVAADFESGNLAAFQQAVNGAGMAPQIARQHRHSPDFRCSLPASSNPASWVTPFVTHHSTLNTFRLD